MVILKIVNKSLPGEPEHAVLQNTQTNTIYEFSQITNDSISDGDLTHPIIQSILNTSHMIGALIQDNRVTLHI